MFFYYHGLLKTQKFWLLCRTRPTALKYEPLFLKKLIVDVITARTHLEQLQ